MIERMQRTGKRLRRWRAPEVVILMYHRVAELGSDPWELAVSPQHFTEQMAMLREWGQVFSLRSLMRRFEEGTLPRRAAAVTFDDGYAGSLHTVKPMLEKYGVPATFFLTTGALDHQHAFWWDELDRIFLHAPRLPDALGLTIGGKRHWWKLGSDAVQNTRAADSRRVWRIDNPPPTRRHRICRAVWRHLRRRTPSEQQAVLAQLRAWAGTAVAALPAHRTLTPDEVCRLADSDFVEIGAHTVTHIALDMLEAPAQHTEITRSKHRLETLLDRSITSFSYPYGTYTKATAQIMRSVGFKQACTMEHGSVRPPLRRLALPRMHVPDVGHEAFVRQLQQVAS